MNIHFLVTKDLFRGGGIETYTREVARRLVLRGHEVTIYSTRGDRDCPPQWEGARIVWLPRMKPFWVEKFFGAGGAAVHALRESPPDVLHLHSVASGCVAPLFRSLGIPTVLQMHGVEWMRGRWGAPARFVLHSMEKISIKSADSITAVSKTQCEYFNERYGVQCKYIPTAADVMPLAEPQMIQHLAISAGRYILCAARLVPEKGFHHLIPAYRRTSTTFPLVIAGDAPEGSTYRQKLLKLSQGDKRIRFIGRVQGRLLEELYSNAALFVQPSELEGLSIGLIEAMTYALPCIASDIPENREVIGDAGLMFKNKDVDDLQRQIKWALENPDIAKNLGRMARSRVETLFSWKGVVDQLETLYERVRIPTLRTTTEKIRVKAADI
jgi:glycosyltransferase involved in cell wall biosynthesis